MQHQNATFEMDCCEATIGSQELQKVKHSESVRILGNIHPHFCTAIVKPLLANMVCQFDTALCLTLRLRYLVSTFIYDAVFLNDDNI